VVGVLRALFLLLLLLRLRLPLWRQSATADCVDVNADRRPLSVAWNVSAD
jgi:hypothetical protein